MIGSITGQRGPMDRRGIELVSLGRRWP